MSAGVPAEADETIFAVARTAGWIGQAWERSENAPGPYTPIGRTAAPFHCSRRHGTDRCRPVKTPHHDSG
ncbi:hypothetical protein [Streptomyces chattanoogensis]|uniref:hypothetical protein n=1 Tax=Streptomyces chattanoogensis TaxID=66876 RepID=UPI003CCC2A38